MWQDIFGSGFKPGALRRGRRQLAPYSAGVPWSGEKFIDQAPYSFPVRLDPSVRLHVTGRCTGLRVGNFTRRNGFRTFELARSGNRVPKNRTLSSPPELENLGRASTGCSGRCATAARRPPTAGSSAGEISESTQWLR